MDDGALATVAVAIVLGVGLFAARGGQSTAAGAYLVAGVILAVVVGLAGSFRSRAAVAQARAEVPEPVPAAAKVGLDSGRSG